MSSTPEVPRGCRENMNYRSLKATTRSMLQNVRKKFSVVGNEIRNRRALQRLNESPATPICRKTRSCYEKESGTPNSFKTPKRPTMHQDLDGYTFDSESNLLITPSRSEPTFKVPPKPRKKKFRKPAVEIPKLSDCQGADFFNSPTGGRLAKLLAGCRIKEQSSRLRQRRNMYSDSPSATPKTPRIAQNVIRKKTL